MVQDGYNFDFDRRVVTVFSAPNYQNMDNAGGIMSVDEQLMCSFKILKPTVDKKLSKVAKFQIILKSSTLWVGVKIRGVTKQLLFIGSECEAVEQKC